MPEYTQAEHNLVRYAIRVLRRRAWLVVVAVIVAAGAAASYSLSQPKEYTAKAVLLFRAPGFDQSFLGTPFFTPTTDPTREAATNVRLVSLSIVADQTARELGGGLTGDRVKSEVEISEEGQSDLVGIKVTDRSRTQAARIANSFARQFIAFRREADRTKINQARVLSQNELQAMSPEAQKSQRGKLLRERVDQLETLAALQTGNAEQVQTALPPSSPSSPRPVRDTALAALLGLALGVGLAFLFDRLDRRLRDTSEVEEIVQRPVLGGIPRSRVLSRGRVGSNALPPGEAEAFRMLRANLRYFNVDHEIRSVLVTSAAPGDGKSTVAANLAFAAAEAGGRTLLIEADLRHPTLARLIGVPATPGLTNVLAAHATLESVVQQVPVPGQREGTVRGRQLEVVVCGPLPPNPSDLMESQRLKELLSEAERRYDLVVVDTPPTSVVSDAIPLVNQTSGVIVVARLGKTTRDGLSHLRAQLDNLEAATLGVVVNSVGKDTPGYGYGYGSAYYAEPAKASENGHGTVHAPTAELFEKAAVEGADQAEEQLAEEQRGEAAAVAATEPAPVPEASGSSRGRGGIARRLRGQRKR